MTISKDNVRSNLIINKELKTKLEAIAREQNRSFNNLIVTILMEYVERVAS